MSDQEGEGTSQEGGKVIRVILRWVQVLDNLEAFFKKKGEFRFKARVSSENFGGIHQETILPESGGYYKVSDHVRWNKLDKMNRVLFEGRVKDHLKIALTGEELDWFSRNDPLDPYERVFSGDPGQWIGRHAPGDEGPEDPENVGNWRVCYDIEEVEEG